MRFDVSLVRCQQSRCVEGLQFGQINGEGTNAEHAMTKGAESAEKVERGVGEPVSIGEEEDKSLLRVKATKLRA